LISSAEWSAKPFFSISEAQFAAAALSGAMASKDTTDFMSSNSFANRLTWARNCVVVLPSSATSYTQVRFFDWHVLHFGLTPSHWTFVSYRYAALKRLRTFDLRFRQLSQAMEVIFPRGVRSAYVPEMGDEC
jgi:hypothetical protein